MTRIRFIARGPDLFVTVRMARSDWIGAINFGSCIRISLLVVLDLNNLQFVS